MIKVNNLIETIKNDLNYFQGLEVPNPGSSYLNSVNRVFVYTHTYINTTVSIEPKFKEVVQAPIGGYVHTRLSRVYDWSDEEQSWKPVNFSVKQVFVEY